MQLLPPDVLQLYIQHLIQQQADGGEGGGEGAGGGGGGEVGQADKAGEGQAGANTGLIQQVRKLVSYPDRIFHTHRKNRSGELPIPFSFKCAGMLAHCSFLI